MIEKLYTTKQVAQIFGVSSYTVREWIGREENPLRAVKTESGTWRVPESEVRRWANMRYGEAS